MKRIKKIKQSGLINSATQYNWNDQRLTLPEVIEQAESKSLAFMHGKGTGKGARPSYYINMKVSEDGVETGFKVTLNQWYNANLPDVSTPYQKKTFVAWSKGQDPNAAVVRPEVSDSEYQEALKKVKDNRGKPVPPDDPLGGRRITF